MSHFSWRLLVNPWRALVLASLLTATHLQAAEPAQPQARLETVEFVSSHHLLCQNTTNFLTGGKPYPAIAWRKEPPTNFPISHSGGTPLRLRLALRLTGIPRGTPLVLVGRSTDPALCFHHRGRFSGQPSRTLEIQAERKLGPKVGKIKRAIAWTLTLNPGTKNAQTIPLGTTGPHVIYVTRGTPKNTRDPLSVVTDIRLERAIAVVQAATAKTKGTVSDAHLVHELMILNSRYYQTSRHYSHDRLWLVPDSWTMNPPGASCISIVGFVDLVCKMIGIEGQTQLAAYYGDPAQPHRAKGGGLGDHPLRKVGYDGNVWQLFMVDESNTNQGGVGGVGGMNYYEAVLEYRLKNKRYYFPGGTDAVLGSPDGVLWVFRSLAWARYDAALHNWVVMEVIGTYSGADPDLPQNVPLP